MRTVAQYAFCGASADANQAKTLFDQSRQTVEAWLKTKGIADPNGPCALQIKDGRTAEFESACQTCASGTSRRWTLSESAGPTLFVTTIALAVAEAEVAFACNLASGSTATSIAPRPFIARCPRVIKDILKLAPGWRIGETRVEHEPLKFASAEDANALVTRLLAPDRTLPIVVASRYDGFLLHPTLVEVLAA